MVQRKYYPPQCETHKKPWVKKECIGKLNKRGTIQSWVCTCEEGHDVKYEVEHPISDTECKINRVRPDAYGDVLDIVTELLLNVCTGHKAVGYRELDTLIGMINTRLVGRFYSQVEIAQIIEYLSEASTEANPYPELVNLDIFGGGYITRALDENGQRAGIQLKI